jgi:ATP-dependent RNA helicase DHX57
LSDIGFLPSDIEATDPRLNTNGGNPALLKSLILAGLWPHTVRVYLPKHAIKFDQVQGGTVRRDNEAKEFHLFDISDNNARVFIHPSSVMFSELSEKLSFLSYFSKQMTTKSFIRNVTEVRGRTAQTTVMR